MTSRRGRITTTAVRDRNTRGNPVWRGVIRDQWGEAWRCEHNHQTERTAVACAEDNR